MNTEKSHPDPRNPAQSATSSRTAREERLAAKLRENLRRRKAQARAQPDAALQDTAQTTSYNASLPDQDIDSDSRRLPKTSPES